MELWSSTGDEVEEWLRRRWSDGLGSGDDVEKMEKRRKKRSLCR